MNLINRKEQSRHVPIRRVLLFFVSILFIYLFFNTEATHIWLEDRILPFRRHLQEDLQHMSLKDRKEIRWGGSYIGAQGLANYFRREHIKDPLVLIPPQEYFTRNGINISMPEPIVFYYYSGLRTTLPNSPYLYKAQYALAIDSAMNTDIVHLTGKEDIDRIVKAYNTVYKPQP